MNKGGGGMVDPKLNTLLMVVECGSYTGAARALALTQPAVSHHIRQLEQEYGVQLFYKDTKAPKLTPEGKLLVGYARRANTLHTRTLQSLEDMKAGLTRLAVGITPTAEENLIPRMMAHYCSLHPLMNISIVTDNIKGIYNRLLNYEVDVGIVEGSMPEHPNLSAVLLDTDYLCLIVSPQHPFAQRASVTLEELHDQKLILRSPKAGTRKLFESYLQSRSESIKNFRILMEIDSVPTIKELVASNLGVSVIAHSVCADAEHSGTLSVIPIQDFRMVREINMVHHTDFAHAELLTELRHIYLDLR